MSLANLPDVQFVEVNPEIILAEIIRDYENAYYDSTGQRKTLAPGDPVRIFLYTQALREIQLRHIINETGKQQLLKYSKGDILENLGAPTQTVRQLAKSAFTRMKLTFSNITTSQRIISAGTRFGTANNINFVMSESGILPANENELIVNVECEEAGVIGNDYLPGQVNVIVDPQPFLIAAENLDKTQGGAEIESDESLRERIYESPEKLSVAGPEGAYIALSKSFSQLIRDVKVHSPSPGTVDIRILLENGDLPTTAFLNELKDFLSQKEKRPLTDNILTNAPEIVSYELNVTYYIHHKDIGNEASIRTAIENSINEFVSWQKSGIGRDVNPSKLTSMILGAGAKRADIVSPIFTAVDDDTQVAHAISITKVFGGVEGD